MVVSCTVEGAGTLRSDASLPLRQRTHGSALPPASREGAQTHASKHSTSLSPPRYKSSSEEAHLHELQQAQAVAEWYHLVRGQTQLPPRRHGWSLLCKRARHALRPRAPSTHHTCTLHTHDLRESFADWQDPMAPRPAHLRTSQPVHHAEQRLNAFIQSDLFSTLDDKHIAPAPCGQKVWLSIGNEHMSTSFAVAPPSIPHLALRASATRRSSPEVFAVQGDALGLLLAGEHIHQPAVSGQATLPARQPDRLQVAGHLYQCRPLRCAARCTACGFEPDLENPTTCTPSSRPSGASSGGTSSQPSAPNMRGSSSPGRSP